MIVLFTDFGVDGPYVGQMHAVIKALAPELPVIDLLHTVPGFDCRAGAYLLPAYSDLFPDDTVFVCVVDPGVGGTRGALAIEADGRWFVGPDNGLFALVARRAGSFACHEITWRPERLCDTFHGRDLFAPVAVQLVRGDRSGLAPGEPAATFPGWPDDLAEVIFLDTFGNAITGLRGSVVPRDARIVLRGRQLRRATKFADVEEGDAFWYVNANGLVEIAANRASAAVTLGLSVGTRIAIS
jgi:S-adenosylmethionine hydrolase